MWTQIIGTLVGPITKLIDGFHFSGEEKAKFRNELQKILNDAELSSKKLEVEFEKEITARHVADMQSDSWLSKNIRPGILLFLTGIFAVLSLTDGTIQYEDYVFSVKDSYVPVYENLLITAFAFYFSSRGVEKSVKTYKALEDKDGKRDKRLRQ